VRYSQVHGTGGVIPDAPIFFLHRQNMEPSPSVRTTHLAKFLRNDDLPVPTDWANSFWGLNDEGVAVLDKRTKDVQKTTQLLSDFWSSRWLPFFSIDTSLTSNLIGPV
jgi:hypothetical protein